MSVFGNFFKSRKIQFKKNSFGGKKQWNNRRTVVDDNLVVDGTNT